MDQVNSSEVIFTKSKDRLKEAVEAGGGEFVGVQESMGMLEGPDLVFNGPTNGHSIPINRLMLLTSNPFKSITEEVAKIIAAENAKVAEKKISVRVSVLQTISKTLSDLSKEIDELLSGEGKCPTNKK